MYFLNDGYLGLYSNIEEIKAPTIRQVENGLGVYRDFFFKSMSAWTGFGTFSVKLNFDDESYADNDIFYYCHIHQFMSGRIKLLKNGFPVSANDEPAMYYEEETPGEFDQMCGVSTHWMEVEIVLAIDRLLISILPSKHRPTDWTPSSFPIPNAPVVSFVSQTRK